MLFRATEETDENKRERVGTEVSTQEFFLFPKKLYNRRIDKMETRALGFSCVIKRFKEHPHVGGLFYWEYIEWDEECQSSHSSATKFPTTKYFGNPLVPWEDEPWAVSEVVWDEFDVPARVIGPSHEDTTTNASDSSFAEDAIAQVDGANQPLDANAELIRAAPEMYNRLSATVDFLRLQQLEGTQDVINELEEFLDSIWERAKNGYE